MKSDMEGLSLTEEKLVQKIHWEVRTQVAGKGKFHSTVGNVDLCCLWG